MQHQDINSIRKAIQDETTSVVVKPCRDGAPAWGINNGQLCNSQADYFSIRAIQSSDDSFRLMLQQVEPALILLIVKWQKRLPQFLVCIRSEPGLIGLTCLTSTVQSTHSNILRKHGGKSVPYVKYAGPEYSSWFIVDSTQFDWGDVYLAKTKRFVIVEVDEEIDILNGYFWVSWELLMQLALMDHVLSNDLRACIALFMCRKRSDSTFLNNEAELKIDSMSRGKENIVHNLSHHHFVSLEYLLRTENDLLNYEDTYNNRVYFVQTTAPSREVATWIQPLLYLNQDRVISLYRCFAPTELFAVYQSSQLGIPEESLWFPAQPLHSLSGSIRTCTTSGEGGRFYRHRILMELFSLNSYKDISEDNWPQGTIWLEKWQVEQLILSPLGTSLELRMAWTLLLGDISA